MSRNNGVGNQPTIRIMKEEISEILLEIDSEIANFDIYGYDIIENSLNMVRRLQAILNELRGRLVTYTFASKKDEITFFKEQKPEILSRLLYFNKIYQIESRCPNGSDDVVKKYLNDELDSLTFFFNKNLNFYQYYRSRSNTYDEYYFLRGSTDIRLCSSSAQFDKDPNFSTAYDYKVAKILSNEMLRIYLNQRMIKVDKGAELEEVRVKYAKSPIRFTGRKAALIELGYALTASGDINQGNIEIKEMMSVLGAVFNIDLGDYYASYIAMKGRKKDRTSYLNNLMQSLQKRMDDDDSK